MNRRPAARAESFPSHGLHWLVLAILLVLTYLRLSWLPYSGFDLDGRGRIVEVFSQSTAGHPLQPGDRLIRVGQVSWDAFQSDYAALLFEGVRQGDVITLEIERDNRRLSVPWIYPGFNFPQLMRYLLGGFWLGYVFWICGLLTALLLRPRGEAWSLAIAFNYFNALGSMFGGDAFFTHIFFSAFIVRIAVWMGLPLYLHFHWVWPRPLGRLPAGLLLGSYVVAALLSAGEVLQLLPPNAYLLGLWFAVLGCLLLLLLHAVLQATVHRQLLWLLFLGAAGFVPLLVYVTSGNTMTPGLASILGAIGLPLIPLAYLAAALQHRLGDLQIRVNQVAASYASGLLLGVLMLPLITVLSQTITERGGIVILVSVAGAGGALAGMFGYPVVRSFLEHRFLGMPLPADALVPEFVGRITATPSIQMLATMLRDQLLPSLLVRQFLFVRLDQERPRVVLATGLAAAEMPTADALQKIGMHEGRYSPVPDPTGRVPYPWIRLAMGLQVEDDKLGMWLLGRRDPDDEYGEQELKLIRSLADQAAIALSHCLQTERLREMYQANVTRTEEERLQLALTLHDKVLNEMAGLLMKMDAASVTPAVARSFEEFSDRLREIVSGLRPPMLAYGVLPALKELIESLTGRAAGNTQVSMDRIQGEARYPPAVELNLFRIVQESCENAIRHARPANIWIRGRLDPHRAEIQVEDDGVGFNPPDSTSLDRLIAQKHFGLAGLIERANLIGASVQIRSALGHGTRVQVLWVPRDTIPLPPVPT